MAALLILTFSSGQMQMQKFAATYERITGHSWPQVRHDIYIENMALMYVIVASLNLELDSSQGALPSSRLSIFSLLT